MTSSASVKQRIVLGMSGGVDSAVSAEVLKRAGYEVIGVTCRFHDGLSSDTATSDAAEVCRMLGIEHVEQRCTTLFEDEVVDPFVMSYERGFTPSPCVGCNAGCKIPSLLAVADELGCSRIATGHYARISQLENDRFVVLMALDARKDQSYMLSMLSQPQLSRLVLPLGGMTKVDVRLLAADLGLSVAEKPESQDVCFIEGDYRVFLQERGVVDKPGDVVDRAGKTVGRHGGLSRFTVGQRKGIGIAAPDPYYVIEKRSATNELVVGFEDETLIGGVSIAQMNWQSSESLEEVRSAMVKLRYRSQAVACEVVPEGAGGVQIILRSPQPTTAPGQYAVLYEGSTVLGGGMIEEVKSA